MKLLDSKPLSFSYANESLIFATEKGNVLVSETLNSNFITQMQIERKPSQQLKMDQSKSSNDFKKDDIDIKPSPLIENSEYSQNSTFSSDSSNAPLLNSVNSVNNEFRRKLSVSKSQDIKLFNEDQNADQTGKKESNKKNRVRKNIIKSCASSSSLLIDSIEESSPAEEEILDKSIVYHKQQHPLDISNIVNIPKIMKNVNRKRRFSLDTSDNVTATSFLSSLANERIQAMPKDSSSVKPQSPKPIKSGNKEQESKNVPPSSIQPENPITQSSPLLATENIQKNSKEEDKHQQTSTRIIQKNEFGNSCSIMWNYQIVKNTRIEHIEWIASTRIFVYTLAKQVIKNDDEKEKSSRRNSISSIDNSDMSQRYSGISFLYLIDLKYHRISRLFEKSGFNITAVAFSPNKQYFFVVINGFMAVLFKNDIQPKQIRSFTFQKKIFVTFAPNSLVIIGVGGEMVFITMPEKE